MGEPARGRATRDTPEHPLDATLAELTGRHGTTRDALLPILHDLQAAYGWIDDDAIRAVARVLNLSRADVHGVVSFYHDFRTEAPERPVIRVCRAEACQARGVEELVAGLPTELTSRVDLEPVYCLGLCSVGPSAMMGEQVHARLDEAALTALMEAAR